MIKIKHTFYALLVVFFVSILFNQFNVQAQTSYSLNQIAGFEGTLPAFWNIGNQPSGSALTWATDQFVSMGHSLKIDKSSTTTDSASWVSDNMCDIWSPNIPANVDLHFGAWIKTENVNTNPTSADQKWYIAYTFYDSVGTLIGTQQLPIDQSQATSTSWMADTTAVGQISLPRAAWKMIISFVGGKNATGTVWADNFIFEGRGTWAGQDWNTQLGVPTGWYYWLPPNGGNDGQLNAGFENTIVTDSVAHTGKYSLKFNMPFGRDSRDGYVSIHRMPFTDVDSTIQPGDFIRVSVWVKASNLVPDSAAAHPGTWAVGITPQFFTKLGNNDGFDGTGPDSVFMFPSVTSFDWTQYHIDFQVPDNPATIGMEARLHIFSTFTGTVYFDDMTIRRITETAVKDLNNLIPDKFTVYQNYPNPFNPTTTISYSLPRASKVKVVIYDILGHEVKTLINNFQNSGNHVAVWNGENNFGEKVASGAYIYRVVAGNNIAVKKMILLK